MIYNYQFHELIFYAIVNLGAVLDHFYHCYASTAELLTILLKRVVCLIHFYSPFYLYLFIFNFLAACDGEKSEVG